MHIDLVTKATMRVLILLLIILWAVSANAYEERYMAPDGRVFDNHYAYLDYVWSMGRLLTEQHLTAQLPHDMITVEKPNPDPVENAYQPLTPGKNVSSQLLSEPQKKNDYPQHN